MQVGTLVTISCILTSVSMMFLIGGIVFMFRYGGQGVAGLIGRFTGGDGEQPASEPAYTRQRPQVASSQALRERASNLDFPAEASGAQASLRPRGQINDPFAQAPQPQQGFQPSMPSLSPSRPYSGTPQGQGNSQQFQAQQFQQRGNQPQPLRPQQGQFQQGQQQFGNQPQPLRPQQGQFQQGQQQFGNQPQQPRPQQGQFQQGQQQFGNQPQQPRPQQGQFQQGQQQFGNQPQPLRPQQGQPQQGGQQQGGLTPYVPPLRSSPRPQDTEHIPGPGLRRNRDSRKGDDYDRIYDDQGGGGGLMDDVGDIIDNF